jgi:hypothetical protein
MISGVVQMLHPGGVRWRDCPGLHEALYDTLHSLQRSSAPGFGAPSASALTDSTKRGRTDLGRFYLYQMPSAAGARQREAGPESRCP